MCCCGPVDTWEKAFALFIGLIFVVVAVFLGVGLALGSGNTAVAVNTIDARGLKCSPDMGDPDGFAIGELKGNLNTKSFEWDMVYDRLDTIVWMRISGPVGGTTTTTGPVVIWLCGGEASQTCDLSVSRRITGKVTQDSHGMVSPRTAVTQVASRPGFYYLEIGTTAFPECALRQQLGYSSGPGQWYW